MTSKYTFSVLTISDRCSKGENQDASGPLLSQLINQSSKFLVSKTQIVPDDIETIQNVLREWCKERVDCIITTGGTGFTPRDVTPEATESVLDKKAQGLVHALMQRSLMATPMAALSR